MSDTNNIVNFSAGPGILPQSVFEASALAVKNFKGTGLSILEMSHRSQEIIDVMDEAIANVKEILGVPEGYKIIFLQGGASLQFSMVPFNLLKEGTAAGYIDTGVWANKAYKEAKPMGDVKLIASSADKNYNYIPKNLKIPSDLCYLHITTNNTIYGTQYKSVPETTVPIVADMSSDIFSKPIDVSKFDLIYAGAQKNMGCAGATLVIVKESILGHVSRHIPSMLNYKIHIEGESMFNTPPVFAVYVANETLKWVKQCGGVKGLQKMNEAKAAKLYAEIDSNPLFVGTAEKEDRSLMNVCFVMKDPSHEKAFLKLAESKNLSGLKGHRSVGGFRASIYNAMPMSGIDKLVEVMKEFKP